MRIISLPGVVALGWLLVTSPATSADCFVAPSGLVGWWSADGHALDLVGTNNGSLFYGASLTAAGIVSGAFRFDGVDDQVVTSGTPADPGTPFWMIQNTFTMEFWAFPEAQRATTPEANSGISGIGGQRYAIYPEHGGGHPGGEAAGAGISVGTNGVSVFEHANSYCPSLLVHTTPISGWTHVAVVYQSRQPRLYLNGSLVRTGLVSLLPIVFPSHLFLGGTSAGYYGGLMDEVSIYSRALSESEIAAIYLAGSGGKCKWPLINRQPSSQVGLYGRSVTFSVGVIGNPPFSYQWRKGGSALDGETKDVLTLHDLQLTNAGTYSIVVSNSFGIATSRDAILTVNPFGVSIALHSGVTIDGVVGETYGIQMNTDLSNTNGWVTVTNITLSIPTHIWFDPQPATQPRRYYQVLPGPISTP